jgi:hypothetical protein
MTSDEDDHDLLRAWRREARETPGDLLDRRVLKAAQAAQARRRLLPLAAAMAACLVLALYAGRLAQTPPASPPPSARLDTSTFGLYVGRTGAPPDAATEAMIRQQPGGVSSSAMVSR